MAWSADTFTTLASFNNSAEPLSETLVQGLNANLYGTTLNGGDYGRGMVFEITPGGQISTLYSFCSEPRCADGSNPSVGLVLATDGNFYGITGTGGADNFGTFLKMAPAGNLSTLHSFTHSERGSGAISPLLQASDGNFYATTTPAELTNAAGTVYRWAVGLKPFVEPIPASGSRGAAVIILGSNLSGTTSVTFNGTPATFTVVSNTEITATVPDGATAGKVTVTTPTHTLGSNVNFHVS